MIWQCGTQGLARLDLDFLHQFAVHHGMQVLVHLRFQCPKNVWVAMAKAGHTDAGDGIKEFATSLEMKPRSLCPLNLESKRMKGG